MRAVKGLYYVHLIPLLRRVLLAAALIAALCGVCYLMKPEWIARIAPRWPATVVIGGAPHYFPLGFVTPHYTAWNSVSGTAWLTVDMRDFRLLPRRAALGINPFARVDVIVSSVKIPTVRKQLDAARAGKGFAPGPHGFEKRLVGDEVQYRAKDAWISCLPVPQGRHCSLVAGRGDDRALYAFFPESVLPRWRDLLTRVEGQLAGCARRPAMTVRLRRLIPGQLPAKTLCAWDGTGRDSDPLAALDPLWWRDLRRRAGF